MPVLHPAWHFGAMRKRTIAVPLSVLAAAAGLAGGAFADSQSNSHPHKASGCGSERAVIGDAARRLHVTPTRLTSALKQAVIDQIDTAVAAGHLTRAQAKTIKHQIERSPGLTFGPGLFAPEIKAAQAIAPPHQTIVAPGLLGRPAIVTSVARYLGLTDRQLMRRLRRGESLAQIAKARGKSESGLVRAITAAVKSQLKNVSKAKHIPRALGQHLPRLRGTFRASSVQAVRSERPLRRGAFASRCVLVGQQRVSQVRPPDRRHYRCCVPRSDPRTPD